jgi:chorismate mutase
MGRVTHSGDPLTPHTIREPAMTTPPPPSPPTPSSPPSPEGAQEAQEVLEDARTRILEVDDLLIRTIGERRDLVLAIARAKEFLGLPVLDPAREAAVVRRAAGRARELGVDEEMTRDVIWRIIASARAAQEGRLPGWPEVPSSPSSASPPSASDPSAPLPVSPPSPGEAGEGRPGSSSPPAGTPPGEPGSGKSDRGA